MDLSKYQHSDSISIDRPPADVYAIVSDITRAGDLSPVCTGGSWDDATKAGTVGAWFTGNNAIGEFTWDTRCEVIAAEPDRTFTFVNHGRDGTRDMVKWGYALEPDGTGTKVTETWQVLPDYPEFVLSDAPDATDADIAARIDGMADLARTGITETLANLKQVAEG
jgi:carbon monoxide dehydrogenase subunit G